MAERLGALPERMAKDRRITLSHYRVAHVIACRANRLGGWGWIVASLLEQNTGIDLRDVRRLVNDLVAWGYFDRREARSSMAPPNAREFRVLYDAGEGSGAPGGDEPHPGSTDPGVHDPRGSTPPGSPAPGSPRESATETRGSTPPGSSGPGVPGPRQVVPPFSPLSTTKRGRDLELRIRTAIPAEFHSALETYLGKTKHPDELVVELWEKTLNPERSPHYDGAIVGQALREMLMANRPLKSSSLVRWCYNLAQDAKSPAPMRRAGGGPNLTDGLARLAQEGAKG